MKHYKNPARKDWAKILERPALEAAGLETTVKTVARAVKEKGDKAVLKYTQKFDGVKLRTLAVEPEEIRAAIDSVSPSLKAAMELAAGNIRNFHRQQYQEQEMIETMPGVRCWRKSVGIRSVGLYIPGGSAPLFSTILMLAIPAQLAGCKEIVLCTPPSKNGTVHPAVLYAAQLTGITRIYKVGGIQAIMAMAMGTESIPKVDKIFGPGNQYVTAAKQWVQQKGVAIDMPAGPSEVAVLTDAHANPSWVAADLLSQAEHGPDSQVLLVSTDPEMYSKVKAAVEEQLKSLPRKTVAKKALKNSRSIFIDDLNTALDMVNEYAPEHLILQCSEPIELAKKVRQAGSVFIGEFSPESAGDYASGTNHTLPTNGYARAYSGVSLDSFVKKITFQQLTREGLENVGPAVVTMAEAEGLDAHAMAVKLRLIKK